MGLNLPDFNVRGDMIPEKVTRVRFTPDKTGTFTFVCDIFCGSRHEEMHGTITVID
jgi:cytochrome c oxidase subunit 2